MVDTLEILRDDSNILWTCIAAFLVFFMQKTHILLVYTGKMDVYGKRKTSVSISL